MKSERTISDIVCNSSFLLPLGALLALFWANLGGHSYHQLVHGVFLHTPFIGHPHHGTFEISLHWLINDVGMALFFAIAGKEVWEAVALKNGSLNDPKKAAVPLIATLGGMLGPILVYLIGIHLLGDSKALASGWAIPTATDIAFSYLIAKLVFPNGHPAIAFLLLLAIADDALGLIILAVAYPQGELQPIWLLLVVFAMVLTWIMRGIILGKERHHSHWPYLFIGGALSWYGFFKSGLHPALGILPIIPLMPHADTDLGIFSKKELGRHDTLNEFEHFWQKPVAWILCLFGLCNAGVELGALSGVTGVVFLALLVGKPLGIFTMGMLGAWKLGLPEGMQPRHLFVLGCVASIGFTVALFVSTVAFFLSFFENKFFTDRLRSVLR